MQMNPYLFFSGQCEEAFKFYEKCLGGRITMMVTYLGTPAAQQVPAGFGKKIVHARLVAGDMILMGCDAPPERFSKPQGFSVSLNVDAAAEAERIFHALAENGKVSMPIQKTFWAERFAMFVDQFGIPWMVNCEQAAAHA
jgi:PhnB protein